MHVEEHNKCVISLKNHKSDVSDPEAQSFLASVILRSLKRTQNAKNFCSLFEKDSYTNYFYSTSRPGHLLVS